MPVLLVVVSRRLSASPRHEDPSALSSPSHVGADNIRSSPLWTIVALLEATDQDLLHLGGKHEGRTPASLLELKSLLLVTNRTPVLGEGGSF